MHMFQVVVGLFLCCRGACNVYADAGRPKGWRIEDFPSPPPSACSSSDREYSSSPVVVDPDSILDRSDLERLSSRIEGKFFGGGGLSLPASDGVEKIQVEVAVAIVGGMDPTDPAAFGGGDSDIDHNGDAIEIAAGKFCRSLHDGWGVGGSAAGGDG